MIVKAAVSSKYPHSSFMHVLQEIFSALTVCSFISIAYFLLQYLMKVWLHLTDAYGYGQNTSISLPLSNPCPASQYHNLQTSPSLSISISQPSSFSPQDDMSSVGYFQTSGPRSNGAPTLESPRIEITAYGQFPEDEVEENSVPVAKRVNSIVTLTLPSVDGYRDPTCLSPASSVSSRSCHSDASSYESGFSYNYDNSPQNSPWQSPCVSPKGSSSLQSCTLGASPRHSPSGSPRASITDDSWMGTRGSRPNSPCGGKRKYSFNGGQSHKYHPYSPNQSPGPSPQTSPRLSVTEDTWLPNTNQYTNSAIVAAINALTTDGLTDLGEGIPLKSRKTSLEHSASMNLKVEPGGEETGSLELCQEDFSARLPFKKETYCSGFLDVPQHPYWSKPKPYIRLVAHKNFFHIHGQIVCYFVCANQSSLFLFASLLDYLTLILEVHRCLLLIGSCLPVQGRTAYRLMCNPSPITVLITRLKAAEGPWKH